MSKTQLEYIRGKLPSHNLKNVNLILGDMATHEFEAASFDRIIGIEVSIAKTLLQNSHNSSSATGLGIYYQFRGIPFQDI
jgi:hypothetical protein